MEIQSPEQNLTPEAIFLNSQVEATSQEKAFSTKYLWLFSFHASSLWCERMFDFAVVLFIVKIFKGTLLMTSIYGLVSAIAPMLLSFLVGQLIDSTVKLIAVRVTLFFQKLAIIVVYTCLAVLAYFRPKGEEFVSTLDKAFFSILLLGGAVMKLSTVGIKIGIERHWLVILTKEDSILLAGLNAILRRIELICGFTAPFVIPLLTKNLSTQYSSFCLMGWVFCSFLLENFVVFKLYTRFPILSQTERLVEESRETHNFSSNLFVKIYLFIRNPLFLTSLSLSMLYCNVLSFGGSMVAYTKKVGLTDLEVASIGGACTLTGLFGTFLAPRFVKKANLRPAGSIFLFQEAFYLTFIIIAIYSVPIRSPLFSAFLIVGTVMARIGLCGYDLVQTQLIQEGISLSELGIYVGFQFGLQNGFELLSYLLTVIWPSPKDFKYPALISWVIVCLSFCFYFKYAFSCRRRFI